MRLLTAMAACVLTALAACMLLAAPAMAQGGLFSGTLRTVRERGTLLLGIRDGASPLSVRTAAGEPAGFLVDVCDAVAADVAGLLGLEKLPADAPAWQRGLRLRWVTAGETSLMLVAGDIDIDCGGATVTEDRARFIAFSTPLFLAETRLLAADGPGSVNDLAGKAVVAVAGSVAADAVLALAERKAPVLALVQAPDLMAGLAVLTSRRAAALAAPDVLLAGLQATRPEARAYRMLARPLGAAPLALAFRREDAGMAGVVANALQRMARDGRLRAAYDRWFTGRAPAGETPDVPLSPALAEAYRMLAQPD